MSGDDQGVRRAERSDFQNDGNDSDDELRVLACAVHHRNNVFPVRSVFNYRSIDSLNKTELDLDVISPVPFAPPVGPYSNYRLIPEVERWGSYQVHYPRFLYMLPKRYFYHVSGNSIAKRIPKYVERNFDTHDAVLAYQNYLDGYGLLPYCRRHDLPLVLMLHGGVVKNYHKFNEKAQEKIVETFDEAAKVLSVSAELAEKAKRFVDDSKVETFPIGADPKKYPVEREREIRYELGIEEDVPVVLFCGEFSELKGVNDLIEAVKGLDVPEAYIICVGHQGNLRWKLVEELNKTRYPARIIHELSPLALRRLYAIADLFVLPSHVEARPTVIYEAMAGRTAVLATDVGGIPEQVADGETGFLIPPKNPAALRGALKELLPQREFLDEVGQRGYERLLEKGWTWENHATKLSGILREAASERD